MPTAEWVSGNVYIRPNRGLAGDVIAGHTHHFDHTTIVFTGSVHVKAVAADGRVLHERDFHAPSYFLVRAEIWHEITFLEDGEFWCVYSHRTPQGTITEDYDGWGPAYG